MWPTDRRRFLSLLAGLPAAGLAGASSVRVAEAQPRKAPPAGAKQGPGRGAGTASMMDFVAPRLDTVRCGFIGVGRRGAVLLYLTMGLEGVDVRAVCEPHAATLDAVKDVLGRRNIHPRYYADGPEAYKALLARDDLDAVFIATPWQDHAPMAIAAMRAGKHVFVEIPAALTSEECWQLVETSEATRRHCMMLENVCYGREELMVLNLVRAGGLGEIVHGEAAYIHDLRWQLKDVESGTGSWRAAWHTRRNGNLYPTHAIGPMAQYMDINRGDRLDYLVSMSSPARGMQLYANREFPPGHARNRARYVCGDMNSSLIRTARGRTILLQHDTTTPRPYSRLNLIQGTGGTFAGFPDRVAFDDAAGTAHETWDTDIAKLFTRHDHVLWRQLAATARERGGHGGMDFIMLWRIVYCLRNGIALDQNVYDAAAWSVIVELSEKSVAGRSRSVDFPDFTKNAWTRAKPVVIAI